MTTPTASTSHPEQGWVDDLATYLSPGCFPATHDHLAATLIQRHAPSHLLWHLSVLSRTREFQSLDELVDDLAHTAPPAAQGTVRDPS
jgi:hypothetical protein